jgi:hypothetical protein
VRVRHMGYEGEARRFGIWHTEQWDWRKDNPTRETTNWKVHVCGVLAVPLLQPTRRCIPSM